ncbi:MAG: ABC transporter ATP-binding protein [Planctomycetaceae bacterium]
MIVLRAVAKSHARGETTVWALRGVSGEIATASFTFIVGPSGSGKSTLLYLMGALEGPTSGEVIVGGQSLQALSRRERDEYRRTRVGFVFQNFNLLSNLNALDNVLVPFLPGGVSAAMRMRAVEILNDVGLGERLTHRPNQLSGGEQQRVAIARALLKRPSLILADEPTGELDSENGAEVFGYLRQLHAEHQTTVVVVTHDQRYLTPADTVWRLRDGKLDQPALEAP